jgi:hypothetical protein
LKTLITIRAAAKMMTKKMLIEPSNLFSLKHS